MKHITKHLPHYASLIGVFAMGIVGVWAFKNDINFQIAITFAMSVAYVVWGVLHHAVHKDLYFETILEYLAFAALGFILVYSLITTQ